MSILSIFKRNVEQKQNPVVRVILMSMGKDPVWTPTDYKNLSEAGYKNCMTAFSCINQIVKSAASVDWYVQDKSGDEVEKHPALSLLKRPNPQQGKMTFIASVFGHALLSGNSYLYASVASGEPRFLYALRPDRVKVLPGSGFDLVGGYEYKCGGHEQKFKFGELMHWKLFNPTNDFYGLGPVEVAARGIDISNLADNWNAKLVQNDMRPSGVFTTKDQLTDAQFSRLKDEIKEEYSGPQNAGKPLLLEQGLAWQSIIMSPKDLDWLNSNKITTRRICSVFGVAPELVGDSEAKTYSNYQEARRALYTETVLPYMYMLRDELNNWLMPMYGNGATLEIDEDRIPVFVEEREKKYLFLGPVDWLTINEKREMCGFDSIGPDGDVVLVGPGKVPLNQAVEEPEPIPEAFQKPQDGSQGDDDNEDDETPVEDRDKASTGPQSTKSYWAEPERKEQYWRSFETRIKARERSFELIAKKYLAEQATEIKRKVAVAGSVQSLTADDLLDMKVEAKRYVKAFKPWYVDAFIRAGNAGIRVSKGELFDDAEFKDAAGKFDFLKQHEEIINDMIFKSGTKVNETTIQVIVDMLHDAVESDMTIDELTSRIYDKLNDFTLWRSRLWARTESVRIDSFGSLQGFKQTEFVSEKIWICSFVPESREDHVIADGQTVGLDDDFDIGGKPMAFPGDDRGGAENCCNCLCSIAPKVGN
jgi:HK97 family phage portal protein